MNDCLLHLFSFFSLSSALDQSVHRLAWVVSVKCHAKDWQNVYKSTPSVTGRRLPPVGRHEALYIGECNNLLNEQQLIVVEEKEKCQLAPVKSQTFGQGLG